MARVLTEDDYVFVPVDVAMVPPNGLIEHFADRWWCVHPEKGLAFYNPRNSRGRRTGAGSPQCNSSETLARAIGERCCPWAEIRFIHSVFRRIDVHDYI
jgi:hypothetical protein